MCGKLKRAGDRMKDAYTITPNIADNDLADSEREQRVLAQTLLATAVAITSSLDLDQVLERVLAATDDVVPHDGANIALLDGDIRSCVLPGAVDLLDALVQGGHALALVTGCISRTALFILEHAGLSRYFPVCVFGDEGDERLDLLHLAVSRAVAAHELEGNWDVPNGLAVSGDAPRDIQAGRALGARVVAVATGHHGLESLARYNPDALLRSLADLQAALGAILGSAPDAGNDRPCPGIEERG